VSIDRATKRAPTPSAKAPGAMGVVDRAHRVDGERNPRREVGEYCPFVSPYTSLLNRMICRSTLRRSTCSMWFPPMESPSPVARDHPDVELRVGELHTRGERRGASVDRVEAIRRHVVRKTGGAPDAGHEHRVLAPHPQVGPAPSGRP